MSFFKNLFNGKDIECPRCLGTGFVDENDIKRLKKELIWEPGICAYCYGTGKVKKKQISRVPVDLTILSLDMDGELPHDLLREKLIEGNADLIYESKLMDDEAKLFIKEVEFLYFNANLDVDVISKFFMITINEEDFEEKEKEDLRNYIKKIIEFKKSNSR